LDKAQSLLGHINDKWTARQIYVNGKTHKEKQKPLAIEVDKLWMEFLEWQNEEQLDNVINDVKNRMKTI